MNLQLSDEEFSLVRDAIINFIGSTEELIHIMEFDQEKNSRDRSAIISSKKMDIEKLESILKRYTI